jgi:hypothetical protein
MGSSVSLSRTKMPPKQTGSQGYTCCVFALKEGLSNRISVFQPMTSLGGPTSSEDRASSYTGPDPSSSHCPPGDAGIGQSEHHL